MGQFENVQRDIEDAQYVMRLEDLLEEAVVGLTWYRESFPEADSQADDEFMERVRSVLNAKEDPTILPLPSVDNS